MAGDDYGSFTRWSDQGLEKTVQEDISLDVPWSVVERFTGLVRLSGSPEEREGFETLIGHLKEWGIPHRLHEPEAFISIPISASVRVGDRTFRAKTPAMSMSPARPALKPAMSSPSASPWIPRMSGARWC